MRASTAAELPLRAAQCNAVWPRWAIEDTRRSVSVALRHDGPWTDRPHCKQDDQSANASVASLVRVARCHANGATLHIQGDSSRKPRQSGHCNRYLWIALISIGFGLVQQPMDRIKLVVEGGQYQSRIALTLRKQDDQTSLRDTQQDPGM
jgi:hypothetical protein